MAKQARFLLASTSEVYGDPLVHPQPESYWGNVSPVGPRGVYDEAKRFAEALTMAYHRYHKLDTRIVRIFNTYGPRMRPNDGRVVSNFIVQALRGEPLTVYGDGSQTRSFCYVDDLIEGIMRLFERGGADPTNIGNPHEFTVRQLAERVLALTGSKSKIVERPLPVDDPRVRQPDITHARKTLGWEPKVSLEEGLRNDLRLFPSRRLYRAGGLHCLLFTVPIYLLALALVSPRAPRLTQFGGGRAIYFGVGLGGRKPRRAGSLR